MLGLEECRDKLENKVLGLSQGVAGWERRWESRLRLTEHSEIGRSRGWMQKAIAGHTGIVASVIRLSGL